MRKVHIFKSVQRVQLVVAALILSMFPILSSFNDNARAVPQERVLASGTADVSGALGAKWRQVGMTAQQTGSATFRLSWTGAADMRFQLKRLDNTVIGGNTSASTTSPKTYTTNLVQGTGYNVAIWAYSGVGTFTMTVTEDVPDTSAPTAPSNVNTTEVTPNSVTLTWASSTDNVGIAQYRVFRNGVAVGTSVSSAYTDTDLTESTQYTYYVVAVDTSNNSSQPSASVVVTTTSSVPDTQSPSVPSGLTSTAQTNNSVTLSWQPSTDNVAVSKYYVYRLGAQVGDSTTNGYVDTGLTADTVYTYRVMASDASGNVSELSEEVSVTTASAPTVRPNIIVINTDDQRADTVRYMPKLQQWLVNQGTTFTNGYVSTPSCCPSRATLMSGRYVHNNSQFGQNTLGFNLDLTTQRYLSDAGYYTGHSGKFLHWLPLSTVAPHFDRWTYFKGGYDNVWMRWDNTTLQTSGYSTTITFDRALQYIDDFESRSDDTPFYLSLAPIAPHAPTTPEPQYANTAVEPLQLTPAHSETDKSDKPSFVRNRNTTTTSGESTKTAQVRTLLSVDDQVDRLMKRLQDRGELDNTLIIYTSDNGYFWAEHGLTSKFLPYKESVSVPFIVRWPGKVAQGAVDNRFVTHVDVSPTILAAAGITQNLVAFDGCDIMSGYTRPLALTEYYYDTANGNNIPTWAAMRNDNFIYIEYYSTDNNRTTPTFREYYDMVNDPYQLQNLLGDSSTANDPDVAALSAQLAQLKECSGTTCQ